MKQESDTRSQITIYLKRLSNGDAAAEDPLAELVYEELQRMAHGILRYRSAGGSLQTNALVNEVLLELVRARSVDWQGRAHFFGVASRLLRRRFIDHIRERKALKRPPVQGRHNFEDVLLPAPERFEEVLFVHEALEQLEKFDPKLSDLVELVYFGGVPIRDVAELRGVSEKTIDRHLELARRWMEAHFRGSFPAFGVSSAAASAK